MSRVDLRFKSWSEEKAFKKSVEETLVFNTIAAIVLWHILLLVPAFLDHILLEHILLLAPACIAVAFASLRLGAGWLRSLNWEVILIIFECSSVLFFPVVAKAYLSQLPELEGLHSYFKGLCAFQGLAHAIVIPFRASFSWSLLLSNLIAVLAITLHDPSEHILEVLNCCVVVAMSVLCWCRGRLLEKRARVIWQTHQQSVNFSKVLPEVDHDAPSNNDGLATLLGSNDANFKSESAPAGNDSIEIPPLPDCMKARHYLRVGATIPDFDLTTTKGNFKLSDFLRTKTDCPWSLLVSHPVDFTPACTTEISACENAVSELEEAGIKLIGLSCDSVESHYAWSKDILAHAGSSSKDLGFPIIADVDRTIVSALGLLDPNEKSTEGDPLPARALVLLYNSTVRMTSLYPASCGRNFENIAWIKDALKPFNMGSSLPAAANPLQIGATIPNLEVSTTAGDLQLHEWLLADKAKPWTLFLSHPNLSQTCQGWDQLLAVCEKLGCKIIGLTCAETFEQHICGSSHFPIILDPNRKSAAMLDILDDNLKDDLGQPLLVCTLVVMHGKTVRLSVISPSLVEHNFQEACRILSSFNITEKHSGLVTPANWKEGNRVLVKPSVPTEEAEKMFGNVETVALPSGKNYLRSAECP